MNYARELPLSPRIHYIWPRIISHWIQYGYGDSQLNLTHKLGASLNFERAVGRAVYWESRRHERTSLLWSRGRWTPCCLQMQHNPYTGQTSLAPRFRPRVSCGTKWLLTASCRNSPNMRLWPLVVVSALSRGEIVSSDISEITFNYHSYWAWLSLVRSLYCRQSRLINCCQVFSCSPYPKRHCRLQ